MMTPLFKKLNYKGQATIVAINSPQSFETELKSMEEWATIERNWSDVEAISFIICFVYTLEDINLFVKQVENKLVGDAVIWLCYPKASSKKYSCEFNRDTGWSSLASLQLEPVRQVAIDEDFSALRFRKVDFIKQITRRESFALTTSAKERTSQKGK